MNSNTMNFGPEWMRRVPKNAPPPGPLDLSAVHASSPTGSGPLSSPFTNSMTPTTPSGQFSAPVTPHLSSYSSVAAAHRSGTGNHEESSESNGGSGVARENFNSSGASSKVHRRKSSGPAASGKGDMTASGGSLTADTYHPFRYTREIMLSMYRPVPLPLDFSRHEYVTSEESLTPVAYCEMNDAEKKVLLGGSVNCESRRAPASGKSDKSGGHTPGYSSRDKGEKHIERESKGREERRDVRRENSLPLGRGRGKPDRSNTDENVPESPSRRHRDRTTGNDEAVWDTPATSSMGAGVFTNGVFGFAGGSGRNGEDRGKFRERPKPAEGRQGFDRAKSPKRGQPNAPSGNSSPEAKTHGDSLSGTEETEISSIQGSASPRDVHKTIATDRLPASPVATGKSLQDTNAGSEYASVTSEQQQGGIMPSSITENTLANDSHLPHPSESAHFRLQDHPIGDVDYVLREALEYPAGNYGAHDRDHGYGLHNGMGRIFHDIPDVPVSMQPVHHQSLAQHQMHVPIPGPTPSHLINWLYKDPSGNIQGPFTGKDMHDWYKGGFFRSDLLVKREDDVGFIPLGKLILNLRDDDHPFLNPRVAQLPVSNNTKGQPPNINTFARGIFGSAPLDHPFSPTRLTPNSEHSRFNPFGGQLSPSVASVTSPFMNAQGGFGNSLFIPATAQPAQPIAWNDAKVSGWGRGQIEAHPGHISPFSTHPLFASIPTSGVSGDGHYLDHQQIELEQQRRYMHTLQQQKQDEYLREQQHLLAQQQATQTSRQEAQSQIPQHVHLPSAGGAPWGSSPTTDTSSSRPWNQEEDRFTSFLANRTPNQSLMTGIVHEDNVLPERQELQPVEHVEEEEVTIQYDRDQPDADERIQSTEQEFSQLALDTTEEQNATESVENSEDGFVDEREQEDSFVDEPVPKAIESRSPLEEKRPTPPSLAEIQAEEQQKKSKKAEKGYTSAFPTVIPSHPSLPAKPAPWGKPDEESRTPNAPSLREIQEAEAKRAEVLRAQKQKIKAEKLAAEVRYANETAWTPAVPSETGTWQPAQGSKKSLREIQKEEEEKQRARARRDREQHATAAAVMGVQPSGLGGKRYADIATAGGSIVNSAAVLSGPSPVTKRIPQPSAGAWVTVGAKGTTPVSSTPVMQKPSTTSAWEVAGSRKAVGVVPQQSSAQQSTMAEQRARAGSPAPKTPNPEFLAWCRHSLKSVTSANVEELIQMFLTFPVEPNPNTLEIISDTVYASSPSLNGRSFAEEFMRRRRLDAGSSSSGLDPSKTAASILRDSTAGSSSAFKLVSKKGRKRG